MRNRRLWIALSVAAVQLVLIGLVAEALVNPRGPLPAAAAIPLGGAATAVAVTPDGRRVLVAGPGRVTIVDAATSTVVGAIGTAGARDVAIGPDGRTAYVTSGTGIDVVDLTTNLTVRTMAPAGADVESVLAVTSDGRRLVGIDFGGSRGSTVDIATGSVLPLFDGDGRREPAATPDGSRIYILGEGIPERGPVRVVDTATGAAQDLPGTEDTVNLVVSPDGRSVYCFGFRGDRVIDTATGAVREAVDQDLVYGPTVAAHDGAHLFEVDTLSHALEVRTLEGQPVARVPLGGRGADAALSPDGTRLYVAVDQSLLVVDVHAFA